MIGPCCKDTKRPSAGVGCASAKDKVEIIVAKNICEEFQEAYEAGRAAKYQLEMGWERMMQIFNVYGQSGGGKDDIAVTEAILAAVRKERDQEAHLPTLIVGDVKTDPSKLKNLRDLVDKEGWIDIGLNADWWGSTPAEDTCESKAGARTSRIDVIFASPEAVLYIQRVWVKKNMAIPTHAAVGVEISRNAMRRERLFAKTLAPLKKAIESKNEEDIKRRQEEEEKEEKREEEKEESKKETQTEEDAENKRKKREKRKEKELNEGKRKIKKNCIERWTKPLKERRNFSIR